MTNSQYQAILDKVPDIAPDRHDALPFKNIGLCGAHRTGKTTLAIALQESLNMPFVPVNTIDLGDRVEYVKKFVRYPSVPA